MLLPIPEDVLQAQARERFTDLVVGSLGVSAAAASATFAIYMAASSSLGGGMTQPSRPVMVAALNTHAPRTAGAAPHPGLEPLGADASDIDFEPTGSIQPEAESAAPASPPPLSVLTDFTVRDAFDGTALVEANGALRMVQPGSVLEGAGTVLSITRTGRGWVVATSGGTILQRR